MAVDQPQHGLNIPDIYGEGSVFTIEDKKPETKESNQVSDFYEDKKRESRNKKLSDVYGDRSMFIMNRKRNRNQANSILYIR